MNSSSHPEEPMTSGLNAFPPEFVAERMELALAHRKDADGLEVAFHGTVTNQMRLAEATINLAAQVSSGSITVRAIVSGKQGVASTTDLSREGIDQCAARAIEEAGLMPAGEEAMLPVPLPVPDAPDWALDLDTVHLDTATKALWLSEAFHAHRRDDLALAGRFNTGRHLAAVRSTTGIDVFHQGSFTDLSLSTLKRPAGHKAGSTRLRVDARVAREQVATMLEETRAECLRAAGPQPAGLGEWDVILSPGAVATLLGWMSFVSFSSRSLEDGMSFVAKQQGERVTGEVVDIVDDGSMPLGIGVPMPFDAEGLPRQRVPLIERGIARSVVHSTMSGRRFGCASTGHAEPTSVLSGGGGASPSHMHFGAGESTFDELVGQVERGIYVTRLHYVNGLLNPPKAVMTGLLRDAAFMIEDGKLTRSVQPMRFTDSVLEAFGRIPGAKGIGKELYSVPASFGGWESVVIAPHVLVPKLRFTSGR